MRYDTGDIDVEADAELTPDAIELRPKTGPPLTIRYVDIDSANAAQYRIRLQLFPRGEIDLYYFGQKYEAFCEDLFERRNASLVKELFLADRQRIATFKGRFTRIGAPAAEGRIDLFPRTIVFFPRWADPFFLRIAELAAVDPDVANYRVTVVADETIVVDRLGLRFEEFVERLRRTREMMERRCANMLDMLVPGAGALAPKMLDGEVIEPAAAGEFWTRLAALVCATDQRRASYAHVREIATAPLWLGVKEIGGSDTDDLSEDPPPGTQHMLWYYAPVRDMAVHEVVSEEDHATYVYRAGVVGINRAWASVQFRRAVLIDPDSYPAAYRKLPRLRALAGSLVGRAIHNERWAEQVDALVSSS